MSGSNGGESSSGEGIVGQVLELEGLLDAVDDSAGRAGFLADWPDVEAAGPNAVGPEGPADMPSGLGDWEAGSFEGGDRSSARRLA